MVMCKECVCFSYKALLLIKRLT